MSILHDAMNLPETDGPTRRAAPPKRHSRGGRLYVVGLSLACLGILPNCRGKADSRRGDVATETSLGGATVARVAGVELTRDLVEDVARSCEITPREALRRLVTDATLAGAARAQGLDKSLDVRSRLDAARAKWVVARIAESAVAAGPPSDAELGRLTERHWKEVDLPEQLVVIHAVVLRPKKADAGLERTARDLAARLAESERSATTEGEFEARANAMKREDVEVRVERLEPFVADGRVATAGNDEAYDATFAAASAALPTEGATTGVVETPFGWHVIRLLQRLPAKKVPPDERRQMFNDEAMAARANKAMLERVATLRAATRIDKVNGVDQLMVEAVTVLSGDVARPPPKTVARIDVTSREARKGAPTLRDMDATSFASILADFLLRVPGAFAAALVDREGECVDYAGRVDPFEVKVAAAHWRIVLDEVTSSLIAPVRSMIVRAARRSYLTCSLPDGYALVVLLKKRAGFASTTRALSVCARALRVEAEWPLPDEECPWFAVDVSCDARGRPVRVRMHGRSYPTDVLGSVVGLGVKQRGFRVRVESGLELTVVREPGDFWYCDERPPRSEGPSTSR